jgi:hypothetical protein
MESDEEVWNWRGEVEERRGESRKEVGGEGRR